MLNIETLKFTEKMLYLENLEPGINYMLVCRFVQAMLWYLLTGHSPMPGVVFNESIYEGECQYCKRKITKLPLSQWTA
jgi:hypothetical protein